MSHGVLCHEDSQRRAAKQHHVEWLTSGQIEGAKRHRACCAAPHDVGWRPQAQSLQHHRLQVRGMADVSCALGIVSNHLYMPGRTQVSSHSSHALTVLSRCVEAAPGMWCEHVFALNQALTVLSSCS